MSFTGKDPSETYKDILYVNNSNSGIDGTSRQVKSGSGADSSLLVSNQHLSVIPSADSTSTFTIKDSGGTNKLAVDTTNDTVKALGVHTNTQYATFGVGITFQSAQTAGAHWPLFYSSLAHGSSLITDNINFGTGTDPATTFTTADGLATDAATLLPYLMYVPDNISIDGVTSIEGASAATGDTTRMHLMSYTFTSGSTSCLTSGTLLAHNSDVTNAGSEQIYLSTWTIDSAAVTSGKVILAFFRPDSVNSDYSVRVTIKYHITG